MTFKQRALKALAACAIASLVAGCGGGGGGSALPHAPGSTGGGTQTPAMTQHMTAFVPSSSYTGSNARGAKYISGQGTSSLVVSVVPTDPAEAAQWATIYGASGFTVCYNIFTNGAVASPLAPGVTVTPVVGPPAGFNVSFPFPSPPGQDTFTITQYAGACSATNPYAPPTPAPGSTAANSIISQSPPLVVNLTAGVTNNFNVQLSACNTPPGGGPISQPSPVTCAVPNPAGTTTITPTLGATISYVYLAQSTPALPITLPSAITLPIGAPMREQAVFTGALNNVGFPLPVVGLDGAGNAVPYTAPQAPNTTPSSGLLPKPTDSIVITASEVDASGTNHFALKLVDATTGAVAQTSATGGAGITLHAVNALACTAFPADCAGGGANGDPYVVMATFDGSTSAASTSVTIKLVATLNGTAQTAQTLTIAPQSSLFTAVAAGPGTGYTDTAAPYASAADILNIPSTAGNVAAGGQGYWVSDAGNMHQVGGATYAVAGATTLTGMTLFNNTMLTAGQILAVDNSQAGTSGGPFATGSATPVNSGIFVFDPVAHTSKPLAVQWGNGNYISFANPQAIGFVGNPTPPGYAYVAAGNKIYAIDLTGNGTHGLQTDASTNFYLADLQSTAVPVTGLNAGTDTGFDMFAGTAASTLVLADTGNNRIVSLNVNTGAVTAISSGHPYVGVSVNGTGYVATDTAGQIYTITSAGVATSLGLSNGATPKDGVVGSIGTSPLAPVPYAPQGVTTNFFGSASVPTIPYNISPFSSAGPVFAGAAQAAIAAGTLKLAPDTSNANFGTTAGVTTSGFGIAFIPAAPAPVSTALTGGSYLFTDKGLLRTLVP